MCGLCPNEILPHEGSATYHRKTYHLTCLITWLKGDEKVHLQDLGAIVAPNPDNPVVNSDDTTCDGS